MNGSGEIAKNESPRGNAETFNRFEELIALVERGDEILICRDGISVIEMKPISKGTKMRDKFQAMTAEERADLHANNTSSHDDLYEEHGLPK